MSDIQAENTAKKTSIMKDLKQASSTNNAEVSTSPDDMSTESPQSGWWYDDNVPGVGQKPEYLNSKYKTLAEQAKATNELHKMLVNTSGAPDHYELGQYTDVIPSDDPALIKFLGFAKNNRFSQDAVTEILGTFVEHVKSKEPDIDKEIAKLGENAAQKITTVQTWAENTFNQKTLDTISKISKNAEVIEFLDEMRQYSINLRSQPPGSNQAGEPFVKLTVKEVEQEMASNYDRYVKDAGYRKQIEAKFEQAIGDQ